MVEKSSEFGLRSLASLFLAFSLGIALPMALVGGCTAMFVEDAETLRIKPGMTEPQVRAILGEPSSIDEFEVRVVMWTYWTGPAIPFFVRFDADGIVTSTWI